MIHTMKFLTQKLKQQSLNENQAFHPSEVDEDRDSGTESDDENAELEALEKAMQDRDEDQENGAPPFHFGLGLQPMQTNVHPPHCRSPQISASFVKRPLQLMNHPASPFFPVAMVTTSSSGHGFHHSNNSSDLHSMSGNSSPIGSSEYDRCSTDYEPGVGSSCEFDRHSSEEELTILNCPVTGIAMHAHHHGTMIGGGGGGGGGEKRTWSQANNSSNNNNNMRCNSCSDGSGSSDDEVKDLLSRAQPVLFSSSPPTRGVQRLNAIKYVKTSTLSPRLYLANMAPGGRVSSVSPRKRHRHWSADCEATVIQRPCLDFEKMQTKILPRVAMDGKLQGRWPRERTKQRWHRWTLCVGTYT